MRQNDERLTYNVEEAGRLLGISRASAFEAARRGDLPTIRVGKRLLVPKRALERMLEDVGKPKATGGGERKP